MFKVLILFISFNVILSEAQLIKPGKLENSVTHVNGTTSSTTTSSTTTSTTTTSTTTTSTTTSIPPTTTSTTTSIPPTTTSTTNGSSDSISTLRSTTSTARPINHNIKPITLTITPDITEYGGEDTSHVNLMCAVSGANLPKIQPYELCWYLQVEGGENEQIKCQTNGANIVFDNEMVIMHHKSGAKINCALIFNKLTPRYFSKIAAHYITLKPPIFKRAKTGLIVTIVAGLVGVLMLGLMAALLYRKFRKPRRTPAMPEEPSMSAQDNVYSYVPLETVSFYQAKAMAASNQSNKMESIKPPPLPQRPKEKKSIKDEEEYMYSYAYGVRQS